MATLAGGCAEVSRELRTPTTSSENQDLEDEAAAIFEVSTAVKMVPGGVYSKHVQ